ncbi:hypothetical protein ABZ772_21720 [Streptomyces griseoincarnatus]
MGYELRRQLRVALGPKITGLQRAVALEIADDARGSGRTSHASLEDLALWTGAKDANVVRNALKRLAEAGWEFRVPIGTGKDGRTLYAVPGKRMTFVVPHFKGVAGATPCEEGPSAEGVAGARSEGAGATPCEEDLPTEGVAGARSEGAGARSEGAGARSEGAGATPSPQATTSTDSTSKSAAARSKKKTAPAANPIPGDAPHLTDVEAVCNHLATVLEKTGSKRPTITKKWRDAARLLIDADGITPEQAITAINWAHANDFWQAHILTPMKLREKYDTLRRQAVAERRKAPFQNPENHDMYDEDMI